jgi:hypothetical protein
MKFIGLTAFALTLVAAGAAEAQTRSDGAATASQRVMTTSQASMRAPQSGVKAAATPQKKIVYRTIVREVPVEPQVVVVREPRTTLVPSILPPFLLPVTTYEERAVYTNGTYVSPSYRVVVDEDASRVLRPYAPETYVVRY